MMIQKPGLTMRHLAGYGLMRLNHGPSGHDSELQVLHGKPIQAVAV